MFSPADILTENDFANIDRNGMLKWIEKCKFNELSWPAFQRLYKLSESILDADVLAEFYLRIDREPLTAKTFPPAGTIGYYKRRSRRFLRKLLNNNSELYNTIALSLLSRAGKGQHSLPEHYWITYDLLFGTLNKRASLRSSELAPTSAVIRCRVQQKRNGRGNYQLLSLRPVLSEKQDALLADFKAQVETFLRIAENPTLPWQTLESAAIRLLQHSRKPTVTPELLEVYTKSPSPFLIQSAAKTLLASNTNFSDASPRTLATIFLRSNAKRRTLFIKAIDQDHLPDDWREELATHLWNEIASSAETNLLNSRVISAIELLIKTLAGKPETLRPGKLVDIFEIAKGPQVAAIARLLARNAKHLPDTRDCFLPFLQSRFLWIRCCGWWLIAERLSDANERGKIWEDFLTQNEPAIIANVFTDSVAISTARDSVLAKHAIITFFSKNPATAISAFNTANTQCQEWALSGLRNIKANIQSGIDFLSEQPSGKKTKIAAHAFLDGIISRRYLYWVYESMCNSSDPYIRDLFWEWCCDVRNQEWLEKNLHQLVEFAWSSHAAETICSSKVICLAIVNAGILETDAWWLRQLRDSLISFAEDATPTELLNIANYAPDEQWEEFQQVIINRIDTDEKFSVEFWACLFSDIKESEPFIEKIIESEPLLTSLKTIQKPTFLRSDEERAIPLIEHWLTENANRLEEREIQLDLVMNKCASIRNIGLQKIRERPIGKQLALYLIESGLPGAVEYGQETFENLAANPADKERVIVDLCDSPVATAREFGLRLLNHHFGKDIPPDCLLKLAESADPKIRRHVLELLKSAPNKAVSAPKLYRRILLSSIDDRKTKELAKEQVLQSTDIDQDLLISMARGPCAIDAEWAIEILTDLATKGGRGNKLSIVSKNGI